MSMNRSELVAETQGLIGYWLQQGLVNAGLGTPVVTLVTQTLVAPDDPAFDDPTKFVGAVYDEARARELAAREGWTVKPDGLGWRRPGSDLVLERIWTRWFPDDVTHTAYLSKDDAAAAAELLTRTLREVLATG